MSGYGETGLTMDASTRDRSTRSISLLPDASRDGSTSIAQVDPPFTTARVLGPFSTESVAFLSGEPGPANSPRRAELTSWPLPSPSPCLLTPTPPILNNSDTMAAPLTDTSILTLVDIDVFLTKPDSAEAKAECEKVSSPSVLLALSTRRRPFPGPSL